MADPGLSLVAPDLHGRGDSVTVGDALDALVTVQPVAGADRAASIMTLTTPRSEERGFPDLKAGVSTP